MEIAVLIGLLARAGAPPVDAYRPLWVHSTGVWNAAVEIAPWGDVVATGGGKLWVLARDTGQERLSVPVCHGLVDGLAFEDGRTLVLVCRDAIERVRLPDGSAEKIVADLGGRALVGAIGGGNAAIGFSEGRVDLYQLATGDLVDRFEVPGEVMGLALSDDGLRVGVGLTHGRLQVREVWSQRTHTIETERKDAAVSFLRFAPGGHELLASTASMESVLHQIPSGKAMRRYRTGSWLSVARFLGQDGLVATGSAGLSIYGRGGGKALRTLKPRARTADGVGLGVNEEGTLLCMGDRQGNISCFGSELPAPSAFDSLEELADAYEAPPPARGVVKGSLTSTGKTLRVKVENGVMPVPGAVGQIAAALDVRLGDQGQTLWFELGGISVVAVEDATLRVRLIAPVPEVDVGDRSVYPLRVGAPVRVVWQRLED